MNPITPQQIKTLLLIGGASHEPTEKQLQDVKDLLEIIQRMAYTEGKFDERNRNLEEQQKEMSEYMRRIHHREVDSY